MLSMHATLRDENARRAKLAEIVLLIASTLFVSTTFAGDELYRFLGIDPATGRIVLGIASVVAFAASVATLAADWRGTAARHSAAFSNFSDLLELFRRERLSDGSWPEARIADLHSAYWAANAHSVSVPDASFNRLKAKHRRKAALSQLIDDFPWCPRLVLSLALLLRESRSAWHRIGSRSGLEDDQ